MSKHKNLKRNLLICLLAGSAVMYTLPLHAATSVIANNTLPMGEDSLTQNHTFDRGNLEMTITQNGSNGIIKWDSFNVGGSATVNFKGPQKGYNTLNYVNGANMSQIYGTINANNNGNIFIVNPAGVQIGNSAQINVGSLHVSNAKVTDEYLKTVNKDTTVNEFLRKAQMTNAALMSLGNINANKVTFEGDGRIVIDSERITNDANNATFRVNTNDAGNVVIGYDAYNEVIYNEDGTIKKDKGTYDGKDKNFTGNVFVNGTNPSEAVKGYMWVEDVEQLQAIGKNANTLSGNYALRNSIDATSTANWNEVNGTYEGFNPIGLDETGKVIVNNNNEYGFTGNFDGLDYNIFGLTINRESEANVGLFGVAHNANINNVTLVGGSITGGSVVGSVIGAALGNTHITNATNSASVTGNTDVGGIVGYSGDDIDNTQNGNISDITTDAHFSNLINTGAVHSNGEQNTNVSNAGGLIGYMFNGTLDGNSYNLGDVSGDGYNVGGLVGHAVNSTIGDGTNLVYNRMDVTGAYNVGGIVGNMDGTTVQNAENSGNVTATWYTTETYYYYAGQKNNDNSISTVRKNETVNVANVGGIAGKADDTANKESVIKNVTNSGNVSSSKQAGNDFYDAGNVGGIVGSAVDTDISNATNKENDVRGAHNVGGVAGYFGGAGTVSGGINDGGDIMATGARNISGFVKEKIRPGDTGGEQTIIGNMGGVVGYLDGDSVYVTASGNRGTVHSLDITGDTVSEASQASNTGGIVGKINRWDTKLNKNDLGTNYKDAAVSNSYNTGDVRGYMGVGGVVGMMYNGEVAGSYNLGTVNTTRRAQDTTSDYPSVNMGGVVGDTTEETNAQAFIYDVYNKGQIGDETYQYYARHVGGVVGRLSGTVKKAYNTGNIYNGYTVVGGIAGWFYKGNINNVFNTGNITVVNNDKSDGGSQVGGIAGGVGLYSDSDSSISYAYNLGTIRSFTNNKPNYIGGIIGKITAEGSNKLDINNVYTTGNLYAQVNGSSNSNGLNSIYGYNESNNAGRITIKNAIYITPEDTTYFGNLKDKNNHQHTAFIDYGQRDSIEVWTNAGFSFSDNGSDDGKVNEQSGDWRIYDGTTPILNAFLPNAEDYFSEHGLKDSDNKVFNSIQYGTAYDPLLTIINTNQSLKFDWQDLKIKNDGGLAVYGGGVTLTDFKATGGTGYFGGIIYADGSLKLDGNNNDIGLGSASQIYGSDVTIDTTGNITIYGDVTATGNSGKSDIDISSENGDVNVYGTLTSAKQGEKTDILGIKGSSLANVNLGNISDEYDEVTNMGERYSHTTTAQETGDITISAGTYDEKNKEVVSEGSVNLYFGNQEEGLITTGGNLTVEATDDVYVDSDLEVGKNMTLTSNGENGEVLLTLTNIGKVQANRFAEVVERALNGKDLKGDRDALIKAIVDDVKLAYPTLSFTDADAGYIVDALNNYAGNENNKVQAFEKLNNEIAVEYMHDFMHSFDTGTQNQIDLKATSGNAKLTVDMWDYDNNKFDFEKYDTQFYGTQNKHYFVKELDNLKFYINNQKIDASKTVYVEVSTGEQLKGIQDAGKANNTALGYNYALMGDINASDVENYVAIGGTTGFTGTFDGRGNRIIGLDTTKGENGGNTNSMTNAGIFSNIGEGGTVKNVNIYSGNFEGTNTAGAVAGTNSGRIENVTGFGNTVTVTNANGNAGGIVGVNNGNKGNIITNEDGTITLEPAENEQFATGIIDVESIGSVIAEGNNAVAGGLVGTNHGALGNSYSDSAVTSTDGTSNGLGGVVGINKGDVQYVDSLGVTNGGTNSDKVGGIIGVNNGNMYSGYNESIVSGSSNVGGIIGQNGDKDQNIKGTVSNVVNATSVTGSSNYVGGLVGANTGSVTNGRNNGSITGNNFVGGLVGSNSAGSKLEDLVNAESADIVGEDYVGGIAGTNSGDITADDQSTLNNLGSITGQNYVGGVAGENIGKIEYIETNISLNVKNTNEVAQYFGGVAGVNKGEISEAKNTGSVIAADADYVGGIVGLNTANGQLLDSSNDGRVEGANYVGGVAGKNEASITGEANDLVTIDNSGVVIAHEGGAGGIFGENTGNIEYAELTNNGIVSGTYNADKVAGTGGLIGVNSGEIKHSSLKNNIGGQVIGTQNVGGLIGVNTGNIEGGRDEANSYYKYQIYNNGVINVGTWKDDVDSSAEGYGKVEADEFTSQAGTNIGGLIGYNTTKTINGVEQTGSLTAGYNTGAINAGSSTNVGGIVGNNAGTVDQVFNTVMTGVDDKGNTLYGTITGKDNVGGLVGTNSGTLSNAYNTTAVEGSSNVGNAVGNNTTGTITNIYASNTSGNLIGAGYNNGNVTNAYSFAPNDTTATVIFGDDQKNSDSYKGFDFDITGATKDGETAASDGTEDNWKIYAGSGNPLLKVFLTKAEYNGDEEFTYNATYQGLTINSSTINATDKLDAYKNANSLLTATQNKNAGEGYLGIYSQQITASGNGDAFDPNNLGYDIDATYDIKKAQLNITLDDVHRLYGNVGISEGGYQISNIDGWQGSDKDLVNGITISGADGKDFEQTDTALTGSSTGKVTENAGGKYTWSADVTLSEEIAQNYEITTTTLTGNSYVEKADLTISIGNAETVYGDAFTNADYSHTLSGITNGDNAVEIDKLLGGNYVNEVSVEAGRDTANAGTYTDMLGYEDYNELQNYNIKVEKGDITVTKADLTISVGNAETVYGDAFTNADYSHTLSGITNGDNAVEIDKLLGGNYVNEVSVEAGRDTANAGTYTDMLGYEDYNELQNYNIKVEKGDITVTKADLTISVGNAETVYGDAFTNGDYSHTLSGITNGDKADDIDALLGGNYVNGVSVETGKATANAGTYEDKLDFANYNELNNYNIKVEQGDVVVTKADLNIEADNITSAVGNVPKYTGTDIQQGLVNGDTISDTIYNYGVSAGTDVNVEGNYTVGIYVDGSYYELSNPDWSTVTGLDFLKNYNVTFTTGTLTVTEQVMPDLPDNWPNNRWDYLFGDNPFDRNENFRERKAEVNFVDGAMEI